MSVVEHLAELTGLRDRDVLDVTLVGALRELLRPESAAIYRTVGEGDDRRWITRARLAAGDVTASADSLWTDLDTLPPLDAFPDRAACLRHHQAVQGRGDPLRWCFPIVSELESVGVLELEMNTPLAADEVRLVSAILRVYRNFQGLLDSAERDTLTGLLNRKTFDENFMRLSMRVEAEAVPQVDGLLDPGRRAPEAPGTAWIGVIDIDHFKRINDGHGHLIGDEVLLLLSRLMRSTFRLHDHLYRFGGEEFVVLLRSPDAISAKVAFERLRRNVAQYPFPQVGRVTVSVGFTGLEPGDTPSLAFERADKAVYWAKQNGRDRVAMFAELVAAGELPPQTRQQSDAELF